MKIRSILAAAAILAGGFTAATTVTTDEPAEACRPTASNPSACDPIHEHWAEFAATHGPTTVHKGIPECRGPNSRQRTCVWDARHSGNGAGKSYIQTNRGKHIHTVPHAVAHRLVKQSRR